MRELKAKSDALYIYSINKINKSERFSHSNWWNTNEKNALLIFPIELRKNQLFPLFCVCFFRNLFLSVVSVDFFFEGWFQSKIRRYSADDLIILRCEKVKKTTIFQYMAGHSMSENLKAAPKTYRLTHAQENYFLLNHCSLSEPNETRPKPQINQSL